jgi:hypothetical protein
MKKFKELNMNEQHREKGKFKPTIPHVVPNVATASPRKSSDSAEVRLKEDSMDSSTFESPAGNQFRQGYSPAARSMIEKPQKEPIKKLKREDIDIPKDAPSVETVAKKHGVSVDEIEKQLKIGMAVEAEHGKNKGSEREIAMDHLNEKPDYYKKLKKYVEQTEVNEMLKPKMSALDKFRQASAERAKKHDNIEKEMQARHAAGKEDMSGSIDRLSKQLNKEEAEMENTIEEGQNKQIEGGDPCWKNYQMVGKKMKNGKEVPNCVPVKEAKDEREYGYEGDMALNQLATLTRCADMIKDLLKPDTDMPEWVQSKITLATDYIQTAADYMYSEMKEEVEQIDELKKSTLSSYIKKATSSGDERSVSNLASRAGYKMGSSVHGDGQDSGSAEDHKSFLRSKSVAKAVDRLTKEEVEQLEEAPVVIKTNKPIGSRVTSIGPGGKETVIKSDPPFEGPYTKVKKTITDKSGAKHSPMSRAKDLARMALSKQSKALKSVKEEKEDSRKAEIVKNVMKSAKKKKSESTGTEKFESEPVLSSDIQKQ